MYLIDTNVISDLRRKEKTNPGVANFFKNAADKTQPTFLSAITIGELRRGIERIRHRGDIEQASILNAWLRLVLQQFEQRILSFDAEAAQMWGRLRVPNPDHELDKQIAAIALVKDLTVVTRNIADFTGTGVRLINPFLPS